MSGSLGPLAAAVEARLDALERDEAVRRLWERDPTLWGGEASTPELTDRLGWLDVARTMRPHLPHVTALADEVRQRCTRVVLLGMGGSSLAPEVLWRTFGRRSDYPAFQMLDSTDPRAVRAVAEGDVETTLFVVASKSGTTIETSSLFEFFWDRTGGRGERFVAITDEGTVLEALARERGFRHAFRNPADIGGRFSALSLFGLVPAALLGIDPEVLLDRAEAMARQCAVDRPTTENPGAWLGVVLSEAALAGRDKLTLLASPAVASFGLWAEQLVAESTGKAGRGILPLAGESVERMPHHRADRLFVGLALGAADEAPVLAEAEREGDPVVRLVMADAFDLGAAFFQWEFATAVAGAVLGINPFDQPNVAESKANTRVVLEGGESEPVPPLRRHAVARFLEGVRPGHYVAVLAYLPPTEENDRRLEHLRTALADRLPAAVTVGYGPRYLHSTGQLHKGGPATGHFIQVLDLPDDDLPIPGHPHGFGQLLAAQALGDARALAARGRPVLRIEDPDEMLELS